MADNSRCKSAYWYMCHLDRWCQNWWLQNDRSLSDFSRNEGVSGLNVIFGTLGYYNFTNFLPVFRCLPCWQSVPEWGSLRVWMWLSLTILFMQIRSESVLCLNQTSISSVTALFTWLEAVSLNMMSSQNSNTEWYDMWAMSHIWTKVSHACTCAHTVLWRMPPHVV